MQSNRTAHIPPRVLAITRWALLAIAVTTLVACASRGVVEEPRELEDFEGAYSVEKAWSSKVGGSAEDLYLGLRPATDGARVYMAGHGGRVQAVETETGDRAWRVDLDAPLAGGPGVGEGLLFVGSLDGRLFALDADDGQIRWSTRLGSEILASPAVSGRYVVVKTTDGEVRGLSVSDGGELWSRSEDVQGLKMRGDSAPLVRGSRVLAGFGNGQLRGIGLRDGEALWSEAVGIPAGSNELAQIADIAPIIAADSNTVYAASASDRMAAVSLSGDRRWERQIGSLAGLDVDRELLYLTDSHSEVHGLNRNTGASIWVQDQMRARQMTAPVVFGETVVLGDLEGYVHFLSADNGELVARDRMSRARINAAPLVVGDLAVVQDGKGRVTAYRLEPTN